jgi:hypothetical protein
LLIERFLNWLTEDPNAMATKASAQKTPKRAELPAPKIPKQITERSLPSPEHLCEIAAAFDARQRQTADDEYEAFFNAGYPNFTQWVESLVEKSANFGGRFLMLTFDNSSGIVTAATPGPGDNVTPNSYALPISQSPVQRVAAALVEHFEKANFEVRQTRQESSCSRTGAHFAPALDCLDILWAEPKKRSERAEAFGAQNTRPLWTVQPADTVSDRRKTYQTAPLTDYLPEFQTRAWKLFGKIRQSVGENKTKAYKGSFSVVSAVAHQTIAKIIIFENGLGKAHGDFRDFADGVYLLVRVSEAVGERIWSANPDSLRWMDRESMIGVGHNHTEAFAYRLVSGEEDEDETIAHMLRDCLQAADATAPAAYADRSLFPRHAA